MMKGYPQSSLSDIGILLFWGQLDIDLEIESDLMRGLLQPKRSMFYNRDDSAGVGDWENYPNSLFMSVNMKYNIADWASRRNTVVGDGTHNTLDRRVAISQSAIIIYQTGSDCDVTVIYIPFYDYNQVKTLSVQLPNGGSL